MKNVRFITFLILLGTLSSSGYAQGTPDDYRRAERLLPWNAEKLIYQAPGNPHWIENGKAFWYLSRTREGSEFILVDVSRARKEPAFDHERLAKALSTALGKQYQANDLPFRTFEFQAGRTAVQFAVDSERWLCDLKSYECRKAETREPAYQESPSPDGAWIAFIEGFNLFIRSARTGEVIQLSRDGEEYYDYGTEDYEPVFRFSEENKPAKRYVSVIWSPDSKYIFTYRTDSRQTKHAHLLQSVVPGSMRALHFSYPYSLPGEEKIARSEPVLFEVAAKRQIAVTWPALLEPLVSWKHPRGFWSPDGSKIYFIDTQRGYKSACLVEVEARSGKARKIIGETSDTLVDHNTQLLHVTEGGKEIVWSSERSGWNHLYLYDGNSGKLKRPLTRGNWVVRSIVNVDEKNRLVYFTAGGREKGRDPYLLHSYRIGMDGKGLRLLTPENADHHVSFAPDGGCFVDTYSRVDTVPVTVLRRATDGRILLELGKADLKDLLASGWKGIEPFQTKARDGKSDIYGALFRPSNLDPNKKYPVIENIYSGPHSFSTPKSLPLRGWAFTNAFISQSIAELGFIVVMIDGLGQNHRGKAFRDHQYRNLVDCGLPDRMAAIKQLAERFPYMDTGRVGIFGFSAGGYAAARAVLDYPEFYKVAVAASGNHDHRMDKLSWNERWMGHPVGDHYQKQSNITDAGKLKTKLLLTFGDLDTNVPPASTIKMVHALMQANKDFDMLIFPNEGHYLEENPYFTRRRWDYFVQNLLEVAPPKEYPFKANKE